MCRCCPRCCLLPHHLRCCLISCCSLCCWLQQHSLCCLRQCCVLTVSPLLTALVVGLQSVDERPVTSESQFLRLRVLNKPWAAAEARYALKNHPLRKPAAACGPAPACSYACSKYSTLPNGCQVHCNKKKFLSHLHVDGSETTD